MDVQQAALAKAILDADLRPFQDARITPDFFPDPNYRRVYEYLLKHWQEYGRAPGIEEVGRAFPSYQWSDSTQPVEYFIHQLQERRTVAIYTKAVQQAVPYLSKDIDEPYRGQKLREILATALNTERIEVISSYDSGLIEREYEVRSRLGERRLKPGHLRGISTGIHGIDFVTGGLQPEHLVTLIGIPKSFKSATLLFMATDAWRNGHRPLFISLEMSRDEQEDRVLSLLSHISLTKILTGRLTDQEETHIVRQLEIRKHMAPFVFSSDTSAAATISGVKAKCIQYNPDCLFIDGVYFIDHEDRQFPQGSAQALTVLTRKLKGLARQQRIPVVVTTQASMPRSKRGLKIDSIANSASFAQDSDVILGVEKQEEDLGQRDSEAVVKFQVVASRSGPRQDTYIAWDWDHGSCIEMTGVNGNVNGNGRSWQKSMPKRSGVGSLD